MFVKLQFITRLYKGILNTHNTHATQVKCMTSLHVTGMNASYATIPADFSESNHTLVRQAVFVNLDSVILVTIAMFPEICRKHEASDLRPLL